MKQEPNIKNIDISERVEVIKQLRLINNTDAEWDALYGRLKMNQRKPKTEDNKVDEPSEVREQVRSRIIYDALTSLFLEKYELDLDDFLQEYLFSSKKYCGEIHNLRRIYVKGTPVWSPQIIETFLIESFKPQSDFQSLEGMRQATIDTLFNVDPTLLLCWVNDWLPAYGQKKGDRKVEDNRKILDAANDVLRSMYEMVDARISPISDPLYDELTTKEDLNHMDLYLFIGKTLGHLQSLEDASQLHENSYHAQYQILDDICVDNQVAWKDADSEDIWTFQSVIDGYIYTQYKIDQKHYTTEEDNYPISDKKYYVKYEGCIINENHQQLIVIRSPQFISYYLQNKPLPKSVIKKAPIELIRDEETNEICQIEIAQDPSSSYGTLKGLPHTLIRTVWKGEEHQFVNQFQHFEYDTCYVERMVSEDFIYIARSQSEFGNQVQITSWFRIPIQSDDYSDTFAEFPVDEPLNLITYNGRTYLFFGHYVKSLDVTDVEACNKINIAIVKYPSPILFSKDVQFAKVEKTYMNRVGKNGIHITTQMTVWNADDQPQEIEVEETYEDIPFEEELPQR